MNHRILGILLIVGLGGCQSLGTFDEERAEARDRFDQHKARFKYALALEQFQNGQIKLARQSIRETISLAPAEPEYLLLLAKIQIEDGELAQAEATLNTLAAGPEKPREYDYIRGVLAERYGRFDQALEHYTTAHQRDPLDRAVLMAYVETLVQLQRYDEALATLDARVNDFDSHWSLHALRGETLLLLERPAAAADAFGLAFIQNNEDNTLAEARALALHRAGRHTEAVSALRTLAVRCESGLPDHLALALALSSIETGDVATAREQLLAMSRRTPRDPETWLLLGRCELAANALGAARFAVERAVHEDPQHAPAQALLGFIRFKAGDPAAARVALDAALRLDPRDVGSWCLMGQVADALGQPLHAAECYRQALRLAPGDTLARHLLAATGDSDTTSADTAQHAPWAEE